MYVTLAITGFSAELGVENSRTDSGSVNSPGKNPLEPSTVLGGDYTVLLKTIIDIVIWQPLPGGLPSSSSALHRSVFQEVRAGFSL